MQGLYKEQKEIPEQHGQWEELMPTRTVGKQGPMGPRGATGAKGDKGDRGAKRATGGVGPLGACWTSSCTWSRRGTGALEV